MSIPLSGTTGSRRLGVLLLGIAMVGATGLAVSTESSALRVATVQPSDGGIYEGTSIPSQVVELPFADIGKIAGVRVKEGDVVEADDILMVQDDRRDRARLRELEAQADISARVLLAEQQRDLAEVQLERLREMRSSGVGAASELEEATLNKARAETQIVEESRQGLVAEAQVEAQQALIEDRTLRSPIAGVIRSIEASVGEVFGPQTPALTLVALNPLEIEVRYVPAPLVEKLKLGQPVEVRHVDVDATPVSDWLEAKVVYIDPVVDASTQRRFFKLELENPELRAAGQRLDVRLPAEETAQNR